LLDARSRAWGISLVLREHISVSMVGVIGDDIILSARNLKKQETFTGMGVGFWSIY